MTQTISKDASLGELVALMTEHTSQLVRDELKLAQVELAEKGKSAGLGAGLFGGAGLLALYATGCLVAAAVFGLAAVMPAWAAALVVAVVLLAVAAGGALLGKKKVAVALPPVPEEAMASIKLDVAAVKR